MATFELYRDNRGEYRWRLKSSSGRSIATSAEAYKTPDAVQDSIAAVKRDAATAGVDDQTATTFNDDRVIRHLEQPLTDSLVPRTDMSRSSGARG